MPTLREETSKNPRDYDIPLNERIIYDILDNVFIIIPSKSKLYEKSFFTNKLKELEISFKTEVESLSADLLLALKRTATDKKLDLAKVGTKKVFDEMMGDYDSCARKMYDITGNFSYKVNNNLQDPLKYVTLVTNRYIREVDECINKCLSAIKSVDSTEDVLNKATYTSALYDPEEWIKLTEEQDKLYKSGKDIFSKDSLLLNIKKLRAFKARLIRIYNKHFGKDSIYSCFDLHDACK